MRKLILTSLLAAGLMTQAQAAPHFVTIVHQIDVAAPASTVWSRIGGYCDLSKWLGKSCTIVGGTPDQLGAVRKVDGKIIEILVGRTATSYAYAQPESADAPTHFYHGTLDVEPVSARSSRIVYSLFYDNADVPAADQAKELKDRSALFLTAVQNMKRISEQSPAR